MDIKKLNESLEEMKGSLVEGVSVQDAQKMLDDARLLSKRFTDKSGLKNATSMVILRNIGKMFDELSKKKSLGAEDKLDKIVDDVKFIAQTIRKHRKEIN